MAEILVTFARADLPPGAVDEAEAWVSDGLTAAQTLHDLQAQQFLPAGAWELVNVEQRTLTADQTLLAAGVGPGQRLLVRPAMPVVNLHLVFETAAGPLLSAEVDESLTASQVVDQLIGPPGMPPAPPDGEWRLWRAGADSPLPAEQTLRAAGVHSGQVLHVLLERRAGG